MEPVYETSFTLRAPDADFCAAWKPGAIFTAMQELGEAHSTLLNAGYFALREKGLAWVITRALLVIDRAPVIGETDPRPHLDGQGPPRDLPALLPV